MTKYDVAASSTSSASKGLRATREEPPPPAINTTAIITLTKYTISHYNNTSKQQSWSPSSVLSASPASVSLPHLYLPSPSSDQASTLLH